MSYNESLDPNSNYPPMSQSEWDAAPWNQTEPPEQTFDLCISQSLSKSVKVSTSKYIPYVDDESGVIRAETYDTDWREVCDDSGVYTPLELIEEFRKFLETNLETATGTKKYKYLHLIDECKGWIEDDIDIVEE